MLIKVSLIFQESPSPSPSLDTPSQDAIALKKALEWELALDSRDLRSHAWYHGPIPRQRADEFLRNDGDFLVRDCVSQPGNYVLSCRAKGQILHFVINKVRNFLILLFYLFYCEDLLKNLSLAFIVDLSLNLYSNCCCFPQKNFWIIQLFLSAQLLIPKWWNKMKDNSEKSSTILNLK